MGDTAIAATSEFAAAVHAGLAADPKTLPCRFFYDLEGSRLFEEICSLPEYYLTRTEDRILRERGAEIADAASHCEEIAELGSGNSRKTRRILDAFLGRRPSLRYLPVDISHEILLATSATLSRDYPGLKVAPLVGEYGEALERLPGLRNGPRLILFLGSNLGNFETGEAAAFLRRIRAAMAPDDRLLLGLDLQKAAGVLNAAYNDSRGVTARFNLNLLRRINAELGADFNLEDWEHQARYHPDRGRVEMRLASRRDQAVTVEGRRYTFRQGETIHTENSCKYTPDSIRDLARQAGFAVVHAWYDEDCYFSVNLFQPGR